MKEGELQVAPKQSSVQRKVFLKIGRPGYRVTKVRDRESGKEGMMVQIHLPQVKAGVEPRRRFMSAWEQRREPPNKSYQYLIVRTNLYLFCVSSSNVRCVFLLFFFYTGQVAAEPYETIAFRIPAREIEDELDDGGYWNWSHWDPDTKQYSFQFMFRQAF
jgi:splicing factor 3A subunit 2